MQRSRGNYSQREQYVWRLWVWGNEGWAIYNSCTGLTPSPLCAFTCASPLHELSVIWSALLLPSSLLIASSFKIQLGYILFQELIILSSSLSFPVTWLGIYPMSSVNILYVTDIILFCNHIFLYFDHEDFRVRNIFSSNWERWLVNILLTYAWWRNECWNFKNQQDLLPDGLTLIISI